MPALFATYPQPDRRGRRFPSILSATRQLACAALLCAGATSVAEAQSWSSADGQPKLRQIVSVDATGEAIWPYGREDIAGDGLTSFAVDEAGTDVRSVYSDADAERLWLRAYVAAESVPPKNLVTFFFADTDDRDNTGGPAFGMPLWPAWTRDETEGGYERAVGVRGDGTLLGFWEWDKGSSSWKEQTTKSGDVRVELNRDEDPLRIGPVVHGYVQVGVLHKISGLTESCAGNLYVRTWHDETAPRAFGDDDADVFECTPATDLYGDPVVIRSTKCSSDKDCPNSGRCRDDVCLFAYPCTRDADCRSDERCMSNACVKVVDATCDENSDCNGLVCRNGACVACSESGANACSDGLTCGPNGTCVDTGNYTPGAAEGTDGGVGPSADADAGIVRGGAFHCAAHPSKNLSLGAFVWALACGLLLRRRAKREWRI